MDDKKSDDSRKTTQGYLSEFKTLLTELEGLSADYVSLVRMSDAKVENNPDEEIKEEEMLVLVRISEQIKRYVYLINKRYNSLSRKLKLKKEDSFKKNYESMMQCNPIKADDLDKFVEELDYFLVDQIIDKFLETNQNIMESVLR